MLRIKIIAVGKIKENYFKLAIEEYLKRISRYAKPFIIETAELPAPESFSPAERENILEKEGAYILKNLDAGDYKIALCIEGRQRGSEEFAEFIENLALRGVSGISFIIGGSLGLSSKVKEASDELLSFSRMTFPHQLMRVILLEQVYRAFKISNGEVYHK